MVNLRPALEATRAKWSANLDRMFERSHFILGEQVAAFESELARAFGARHAVATGSGTAAIELALRAGGLRGEVVVPALTSPFTAQAVLAAGCRIRFADVHRSTLLLDAAGAVTRSTVAIVPVHLYGQVCDLRGLERPLVQDACQAHGIPGLARWGPVAYSFYPTKNLGCLGDGGAVLTNQSRLAARLRLLRDGGRGGGQVARIPAPNSRLDEMQACYLRAFLPRLAEWNARRARLAALYDQALGNCSAVRPVERSAGSVHHLYVIRVPCRQRLRRCLAAAGIQTAVHYPVPLHRQPAFRQDVRLPHAERACREIVSLPLWPYMPDDAVLEVAGRIAKFYGG